MRESVFLEKLRSQCPALPSRMLEIESRKSEVRKWKVEIWDAVAAALYYYFYAAGSLCGIFNATAPRNPSSGNDPVGARGRGISVQSTLGPNIKLTRLWE